MEYASAIVRILNERLLGLSKGIKTFGIAKLIIDKRTEKDSVYPATQITNSEFEFIDFESCAQIVYHRVLNIQTSQSSKPSYGRFLNPLVMKMRMCLVLFSDSSKLKLTSDQIALNVHGIFPRKLIKTIMPGVKNTSIIINDTILNDSQVFNEEFKNIDSFLSPEHSFIKINYTVESTVSEKCFNTICKQTS